MVLDELHGIAKEDGLVDGSEFVGFMAFGFKVSDFGVQGSGSEGLGFTG